MTKYFALFILLTAYFSVSFPASGFTKKTNMPIIDVIHSVSGDKDYYAQLLTLALSYSDTDSYNIIEYKKNIPKARRLLLLNTSNELHVEMGSATKERESAYLAIPFPLLKGLNGWRVPLVNTKTPDKFKYIISLDEFKTLVPVQYHSWSDSRILTSNGIRVAKGGNVKGLYNMLHTERVDYFPRSVVEVDRNLQEKKHLNITKDEHIFIHYPTAFYFYVGKNNTSLATDIKTGLEKALSDGTFDILLMKFYGKHVKEVEDSQRRIFNLNNPYLPNAIPLDRKELWIKPTSS